MALRNHFTASEQIGGNRLDEVFRGSTRPPCLRLPTCRGDSTSRGQRSSNRAREVNSQAWTSACDFTGTICATRSMTLLFWLPTPLPLRDAAQSIRGIAAATAPHPGITQRHVAVRRPRSSSERAKQSFASTGVVAFLRRQGLLSRQSRAWRPVPREGTALRPQCNHRPWKTLLKQFLRRANYRGLPIELATDIRYGFGNDGICDMYTIPG